LDVTDPGKDKGEEDIKNKIEAPPKRKRGERAGIDLDNIVDAAIRVVSRNGVRFQIKDVAEELGVTRGALHPHFRTAEKLRREVAIEVLLALPPRRRSAGNAVLYLKTLVRGYAELTEDHPRLAELAGTELVVDPWIYPRLILTLSEAIDEIGVEAELHLAAMSFALAVIVSILTGINKHLWRLAPSTWPTSVSSLVKVLPPTALSTLRTLMASKGEGATMAGSADFNPEALGDPIGEALIAGLKNFARPTPVSR
jgi:AcrR family transcriptional regulator